MSWDDIFSPDYWENCTTPDSTKERFKKLERICKEHSLADLQQKIRDRSARILEV